MSTAAKRPRLQFQCALVCALVLIPLLAQPVQVRADGRWRHFADELLSTNVLALAYEHKDTPGDSVLWVGSEVGLQSYNGLTWLDRTTEATGKAGGRINALLVDTRGVLWVGADVGIRRRLATGEWRPVNSSDLRARHLVEDGKGGVYAGTAGEGVWHCSDVACRQVVRPQLMPDGVVEALLYTNNELWIGARDRLIRFKTETEQILLPAVPGLQASPVSSLAADSRGAIWVGGEHGVARYDLGRDNWSPAYQLGHILGLTIDQAARVWAATDSGLFKWDPRWPPETWQPVTYERLQSIRVVLAAADGMLWVGTQGSGLSGLDSSWQTSLVPDPTLEQIPPFLPVNALIRDAQSGELWAGTSRGVRHYDPATDQWDQLWTTEHGLLGDSVRTLLLDPTAGELWAGTDGGISRYNLNARTWDRHWTPQEIGLSSDVRALMHHVKSGEIWAGGYGGISRYDRAEDAWTRIDVFSDGAGDSLSVLCLTQDSETSDVWAGTTNGIWQYLPDLDLWVSVASDQQDTERPFVGYIDWDATNHDLWVGTSRLVYRYHTDADRRAYKRIPVEGWPQDTPVSALLHDATTGTVWAGSYGGLYRYNPGTARFDRSWTVSDGLISNSVLAVAPGDQAGELWVGTGNGVSRFYPRGPLPWVRLKRALADGQDQLYGQEVKLNAIRSVELVFEGGSFAARPSELSYGYRLDGHDQDVKWLAFDAKLEVPYTDLRFGRTYTFELWVRDMEGRQSIVQRYPVHVSFLPRNLGGIIATGGGVLALLALLAMAATVLYYYSSYAVSWGAAYGHPVRQLIPLVAPLREPLDVNSVQTALQRHQAFTTPERIKQELEALVKERILRPAQDGGYRFVSPVAASLLRLQNARRSDSLAESVRSQHPLYAGARAFFQQAGFQVIESDQVFLLVPSKSNPLAHYRAIYTHLIAGHAPEGDDFEEVARAAHYEYRGQVEHRLAFVVSNRRPTPGARFRLYEIRQRSGLAVIHIDSDLFGQVKPNMPAANILAAQVDQATGQQNLYRISSPVSDDLSFFGRETVLQQLIDLIEAGQPVGVFGLRKTGKTSLSQRLQGRLATRRVIAAVDTQGTAREQGVLPLYPAIIGAFVSHIEQYRSGLTRTMPQLNLWPPPRGRTLLPNIIRVFSTDLIALQQHIGGDERLLLIIDEIDRLLPDGEDPGYEGVASFLGQLRDANQGLKILDFIVIGVDPSINRRDKWSGSDNGLYQALHEVWMPPMDPNSAREMIESIGFQMGVKYDSQGLQKIIAAGGGQPFVTRQICAETVEEFFGHGEVTTIDEEQARLGIEAFIFQSGSYLDALWRERLDDASHAVLRGLAESDTPVPRTALLPPKRRQEALAVLRSLQERTLIRRQAGGYTIGWGVLRDWIRWIELGLDD